MNILHTSDLHLGKMLENYSRIDEQIYFFEELNTICEAENIDIILIAGDIYDVKNPKAIAEKLFYKQIKNLSKNGERLIIIIAGNHDSHERIMTFKPLVEDDAIIIIGYPNTIVEVNDYPTYRILESFEGAFKVEFKNEIINVLSLAYPSEQSLNVNFDISNEISLQMAYNDYLKNLLDTRKKIFNNNEINLFIGHLFLRGGETTMSENAISVGGSYQVSSSILPSCDYIALGHLHRSQEINGETLAYYSGSPIAYSFSEHNHKKSVNVCNISFINDEKIIDVKKVPLTSYIPLEIWNVSSPMEAIAMCEVNKDSKSYVDLRIKTDEVLNKSLYSTLRALKENIVYISAVPTSLETEKLETTFNFEEKPLIEEFIAYYKEINNTEPERELLDLFVKFGEKEDE